MSRLLLVCIWNAIDAATIQRDSGKDMAKTYAPCQKVYQQQATLAGSTLLCMADIVGMTLETSTCCMVAIYLAQSEQDKTICQGQCHASQCTRLPATCSPKHSVIDCMQLGEESAGLLLIHCATLPTCIQENFIPAVSDLGGRIVHSLQCTEAREDS